MLFSLVFFFFQAEDGIRDIGVTGVQTCALPISRPISQSICCTSTCVSASRSAAAVASGGWKLRASSATRRRPRSVSVQRPERKSVVEGKSVDLGGGRIIKKKIKKKICIIVATQQ